MPSELRRINVLLEPELEEALLAYVVRTKRSLGYAASLFIEQGLVFTGDLKKPLNRQERRGGFRPRPDEAKSQGDDVADEG